MILDAYVDRFVGLLATLLKEEVVMLLGVNDELRRFKERLEIIKDLLEDAERKRIHNKAINNWLNKLKDVMYDADDMLDLCRIEGEKRRSYMEQQSSSTSPTTVRCLPPLFSCFRKVPFRHEIGTRIKELNVRLEEISKQRSEFQLVPAAAVDDCRSGRVSRDSSPVVDSDVVGNSIEENTKTLVELLIKVDEGNCPLFAITGMGGIGKTTLAQKVINDKTIKNNFEMLIWVCVSKDFKEVTLLKEIIRSAGGNHGDAQTRAELEPKLRTVLESMKILLVLDDVWVGEVWDDLLRNPLQSVMTGSRVLVTTRNESVARQMGAIYVQHVEQMPLEDGWDLLCKKGGVIREREIDDLREIGMQIVEKCHGLPLAIKATGGVLKKKGVSRREWEKVLQSEAWSIAGLPEEIEGALYLSYEDLPSPLKQCFLYCSLFPEDHQFNRNQLVDLWIVEDFVQGGATWEMENLAIDYYKELIERSLLQPDPGYFGQEETKMHDVLRSFGQYLTQGENHFGDLQNLKAATSLKLRRLSFAFGGLVEIPDGLKQHAYLRTLLLSNNPLIKTLPMDLFEKLRHLRVLNIRGTMIEYLPESVCHLIHLRSLDISDASLKELPDSIVKLVNLSSLDLRNCPQFHNLPNGITRLCNLRRVELQGTPVSHIPMGIGGLKHLNVLTGAVFGDSCSGGSVNIPPQCSNLEELNTLTSLTFLEIVKLELASVGSDARGETLKNMSRLRKLGLEFPPRRYEDPRLPNADQVVSRTQGVFEELSPPSCLEQLNILGFFGRSYPKWLLSPSIPLSSLAALGLRDCFRCKQLPPLGLLPQLKLLIVTGLSAVETIGAEFLGGNSISFPKLEYFQMSKMPKLREWNFMLSQSSNPKTVMPNLTTLRLINCPMLTALPVGLRQGTNPLEYLLIKGAPSLRFIENDCFFSKSLGLKENQSLERVSNMSTLEELDIEDCQAIKQLENLNGLKSLCLEASTMKCFPEWLVAIHQCNQFTNELMIYLQNCELGLLKRCLTDGPDWPKIQQLPHVNLTTPADSAYLIYRSHLGFETNMTEPDAAAASTSM